MMFLIRRHLVSVELSAFKAKMTGQTPEASSPVPEKPHHALFRMPWKKSSEPPEPPHEERVEETAPSEQVAEPNDPLSEPNETVTEPAEEGTESDDHNY
jgi:hypothetical protein